MLLSPGQYRQDAASLWALQTGCCFPLGTTDRMLLSSGHYRQDAAFLWALQTGCCFPLGTTDRMLLSSGHYRQEVFFLWALQTGSFVFLWALHSQDVLGFKSGLSITGSFVFLWAFHKQRVLFTPRISTDRKFYVFFCVVLRQNVIRFSLGSLAVRISLLSG